jgi:hypothetical protein
MFLNLTQGEEQRTGDLGKHVGTLPGSGDRQKTQGRFRSKTGRSKSSPGTRMRHCYA